MSKLRITWVRSAIDYEADQKATLRALGLRRLHQTVVHDNNPSVKGMVFKVKHMLRVEEVADHEAA
ncbi:MAG: 50S ribosomal protein L30 [Chloroflexi bacterium]|nr:50S ribosomal protein L30 [Chloroflexota bacterium]